MLAIDVGNSITTVGLFGLDGQLCFRSTMCTRRGITRDQCAVDLAQIFLLYGATAKAVTGAIVSSVVPPVTAAICDAVSFLTGITPMLMGPGVKTGLNIRSDIHTQMGTDLVACSVAAIAKYPGPIIVVDMGTAIAMSVLVGNNYEGCVLLPGVAVALEALSTRAAELPHISIEPPPSILGHNTVDAMRSGIIYGNAGMVDSMITRLEDVCGPTAAVVGTGEAGVEILQYCKRKIIFDANLLLDGLYLIHKKSTTQKLRKA